MTIGLPPAHGKLFAFMKASLESAVIYFEIPPLTTVKDQFHLAAGDIAQASKSTYKFLNTTSRPLFIFIALISKYIWIALRIISEHTIYHGIRVIKEVLNQLRIAMNWLVNFQKSLSHAAIGLEFSFIAILIGMYLLRKYIERKRYVQRVTLWYQLKKIKCIRKYNDFVDQVAETSMFMALILPHAIYGLLVTMCKIMVPSFVGYFANKTICADVLAFYYPLMKTIHIVHRWKCTSFAKNPVDERSISMQSKISVDESSHSYASLTRFLSWRRKSHEDMKNKNDTYSTSSASQKVTKIRLSIEEKQIATEASELLQYWVVYGILYATVEICTLLPFVGSFFSNLGGQKTHILTSWRRSRSSWLDRWRPSSNFWNELKLIFFIWLQILPTSLSSGKDFLSKKNDLDPSFEHSPKKRNISAISNRPINILYSILSPTVIQMVSSSSSAIKGINHSNGKVESETPFILRAIEWCRRFLDAIVWMKLISANTKNQVIAILVELVDLAPAAITLFMPSYFTSYGVVYVQYIVPCAVSSDCVNSFKKSRTNSELVNIMFLIVRYLQYWTIECFADWIISSFDSILAWIPFSKHIIWLLWAYLQLEGTSKRLHDGIEWDLVAFGLLKNQSNSSNDNDFDLNDTATMKVFHALAKLASPTPKSSKIEMNDTSSELFRTDEKGLKAENSQDTLTAEQIEKELETDDAFKTKKE